MFAIIFILFQVGVSIAPGLYSKTDPAPTVIRLNQVMMYPLIYVGIAFLSYSGRIFWRGMQGVSFSTILGNLVETALNQDDFEAAITRAGQQFAESRRFHEQLGFRYITIVCWFIGSMLLGLLYILFFVANSHVFFAFDAIEHLSRSYADYSYEIAIIFPQTSRCKLEYYGVTGSLTHYDGLCYMHYVIINQVMLPTIYLLLAFGMVIMCIELVWLCICRASIRVRRYELRWRLGLTPDDDIWQLTENISFGSYFVIINLLRNLPAQTVLSILEEAAPQMDEA